jgi:hypothetical protein
MFYVKLPFRPWRRKDRPTSSHTERHNGSLGSAGQPAPSASTEAPLMYVPPEQPIEGKRSRLLDKLRADARSLRAGAENSELEGHVRRLEVRCFVAADALAACAALVEESVSQAEVNEAKAFVRKLLEQA